MKRVKFIVVMYLRAQSGCATTPEISTGRICYAMRPNLQSNVPCLLIEAIRLHLLPF